MAAQTRQGLACALTVLVWVTVKPSQTQRCPSEKIEDVTIDIPAAFSKGIRGTDPIHAPSWEACLNTCCLKRIAGDKRCNYLIFNSKMKGSSPNCYQFYFPAEETCPVKHALGLVTYRIIEGKEILRPAPSLKQVPPFTVNGNLASSQAAGFGLAKPMGGPDSWPRAPKEKETFDSAEHPTGKVDGPSQHPDSTQNFGSSLVHESSSNNTVQQSTPFKLSLATVGSSTSRTVAAAAAAIHNSPSHASSSAPFAGRTEAPPLPLSKATIPKPSLPPKTGPRGFSSLSSTLPTSSFSVRNSHLAYGHLSLGDFSPDGSAGRNDFPLWSDQSLLFAALFFGVLFLFLAVVLMGGKVFSSHQPQRYTRLDYLINDMYANM